MMQIKLNGSVRFGEESTTTKKRYNIDNMLFSAIKRTNDIDYYNSINKIKFVVTSIGLAYISKDHTVLNNIPTIDVTHKIFDDIDVSHYNTFIVKMCKRYDISRKEVLYLAHFVGQNVLNSKKWDVNYIVRNLSNYVM